jgi:cytochrome oxidase Cu insertion factor (SCO1/SenC/PrrC family)
VSDLSTRPATTAPEDARLTKREFLSVLALGLLLAGGAAAIALFTGQTKPLVAASVSLPDHPRELVAFSLTERSGRTVTHTELAGKFLVVNFVFTGCSLSCRVVNDRMAEIQRLVAGTPDVQLVSLTVDPRSDSPAALTKFAAGYGADSNRWLFLTGETADVYRLIETSFIPRSPELASLIPGGFTNTDRILLVDSKGTVCTSFNGLNPNVARLVTAEIERHRKSDPPH